MSKSNQIINIFMHCTLNKEYTNGDKVLQDVLSSVKIKVPRLTLVSQTVIRISRCDNWKKGENISIFF